MVKFNPGLQIKEQELCSGCSCVFDNLYTQAINQFIKDWDSFDLLINKIKS